MSMLSRFLRRTGTTGRSVSLFPSVSSSFCQERKFSSSVALQSSLESGLNDDQLAFQELALNFMEEKLKPFAKEWDEAHHCPYDVIKESAALGFGGLYCSQESGGTGLSRHDSSLIFEALSQGCVATTAILTIHNMTAWMLDKYGSESLKKDFLQDMIECNLMGSYCLTEPQSGSDAAALTTSCQDSANGELVINGSKMFISGGNHSDLYFVMTRTGEKLTSDNYNSRARGITCVLIPKDAKGVIFGKNESKMGWNASPTCTVTFDNVRIPKTYMIGNEGDGFKIALSGLDGGRINIAACSLGAAHRCLNETIAYSKERSQFLENISDMQHNSFKIADLACSLHTMRLMLRDAAKKIDENDAHKTMYSAMAKKYVTDVGFDICNQSLQFLGGYGYLKEYEIERFVRDTRVHQILEGTNEIMRLIISRNVLAH